MNQTPNTIFARQNVLFALLLAVFVNIPLLLLTTLFWDDWTWLWVFQVQGAAAFQDYMWQSGHPMYGPVMNLIFWLGGDSPGRLARAVSLASHLGSGWLIWKIFKGSSAAFSATLATLFLLAPFLAVRVSLAHVTYDCFIFLYLLSIWLSGLNNPRYLLFAMPAMFIGLGIEPLASLEPIRWWYLYARGFRSRELLLRCTPFAAILLAVATSRMTWLTAYGAYAGYNKIAFHPIEALALLGMHLRYFIKGIIVVTKMTVDLVQNDSIIFSAFLLAITVSVASAAWRIKENIATRNLIGLSLLAVSVFLLGVFSYALINRVPQWEHFSSRFAVASQFGVLIAMALSINIIPWRATRSAATAIVVVAFAGTQIQLGKSALYEELVLGDFRRQAALYLETSEPQTLKVHFLPPASQFTFRNRPLDLNDMNVWFDLSGHRHGSILFDGDFAAYTFDTVKCSITNLEVLPCPEIKKTATFRIRSDMQHPSAVPLLTLIRAFLFDPDMKFGELIVE